MKTIQPDTLLFDLDNTLINRNSAMHKAMQHWLQHHTAPTSSLDAIMEKDSFGYADRIPFCQWLLDTFGAGDLPYNTAPALLAFIQQQLVANIHPEPEVNGLLQRLQQHYRLVLASNGSSRVQRAKLQQSGLNLFFHPSYIFISGEMEDEKPALSFFNTILSQLSLLPGNTLMIGDDYYKDVAAPRQCGLLTCWVSHGRQQPDGAAPDITIPHITELEQWLKH